jgi:hypothetical protein
MRWFRSNRHLAHLAVIAVALQLVLTFGHAHSPLPAETHYRLSVAAAGSDESDSSGGAPNGLAAEPDCPVCGLNHLSAVATFSVTPALAPPAAQFVTLQPDSHATLAAVARISQRARAPPAA